MTIGWVLSAICAFSCAPGVTPAGIGDPMPAIALPGLDGAIVDLRTRYAGRRLLINVWASWCGPCIEEMPELDRFAATQGREGVQVIGLALDTPDGVRDFIARVPVRYPILLDAPGPADASVWLGNAKGVTDTVQQVLQRPARTVAQFVQANAALFLE